MRISDWSSDVCSSDLNSFEGDLYPITSQKRPDRSGNQNQTALRGKLVWTPTDNLKIRLIGDYLRVNEQAAPFSLLRVEQNAYVAVYNTCITGNAAIIAGVSALDGLPGLSNICTGVRGNAGSSTVVQPTDGKSAVEGKGVQIQ